MAENKPGTQALPDFAARVIGLYNGAALSLMISIGHRTGLFDAMAGESALDAVSLARKTGLDERYVREWLGAMVTGRIVEYDEERDAYVLPPDHAAFLTRAAAPNNLAVTAQFISVLGGVEDRIVECFGKGGGVPYSAYPRFHEVMAEESYQTVVLSIDESILPLVPGLQERLRAGADVLDVGCGSGLALLQLASRYPASHFTGYDFSEEVIRRASRTAAGRGLENVRFAVKDVTAMDDSRAFDLVTAFDAIHDQIAPDRVLAGIRRALRPGGRFLMQDIKGETELERNLTSPLAPFLFTISCMHCMTVSLSAGGAGLGAMWGRTKALDMLKEAGFAKVDVRELPHDIMNYYYVAE